MKLGDGCKICVSIASPDAARLQRAVEAVAGADLIEVRLDALDRPAACDETTIAGLIGSSTSPLVFTCRPTWEGGDYDGAETDRRALLLRAAAAGAAYVDIEHDAEWARQFISDAPVPVILSHHFTAPGPADLAQRADAMARMRPAVVKLVAPAEIPADGLPLLRVGQRLVADGQPATAFCVGRAGSFTRLLAATYGAAVTYAAPDGAAPVAEGQWPLAALREEFRLPRWRPSFRCCGLLGDPIGHSLSPTIFNAAFEAADLSWGYLPLASPRLGPALEVAESWEFRGLSVTMPFKGEAMERCVRLDPLAQEIGAVNTMVATEDGWVGHNTDATAVSSALARAVVLSGARVAIVGAGGAARAAAVALARAGAAVTVLNRTPARAAAVAEPIGAACGEIGELAAHRFDVVINATPVGMTGGVSGDATPFPADWLGGEEVVFDFVYRPRQTPLLRAARQRGCRTIDGVEMFIRQAAAQYELWTGEAAGRPVETMRAAAEVVLGEDEHGAPAE